MMETFFNVSEQTMLFLGACVCGAVLGVFFDFFRALRTIVTHCKVAVFFEDLIYTIFFSFFIFVYTTQEGRGEIRLYIYIGAILGFIIYYFTIGTIVINIIRMIYKFIYKIFLFVKNKILIPIKHFLVKMFKKSKENL